MVRCQVLGQYPGRLGYLSRENVGHKYHRNVVVFAASKLDTTSYMFGYEEGNASRIPSASTMYTQMLEIYVLAE